MLKIVAIIQARQTSTRLPNKIFLDLGGYSVLECVTKRAHLSKWLDEVVIAYPENHENLKVKKFAQENGFNYLGGSENDVLDRFYMVAKKYCADIIVRLTADNPIVDGLFIDWVIKSYLNSPFDYVAGKPGNNSGLPFGLSVEVFSFNKLKEAWENEPRMTLREHVTPYIYQNNKINRIKYLSIKHDYSRYRCTLDTLDDYKLVSKIYESFSNIYFPWGAALAKLLHNPAWLCFNSGVVQKSID